MSADVQPMIFFDRTRAVRDDECPRARFWAFEAGGRGVVSGRPSYHLTFGSVVHDALADLAAGKSIAAALTDERYLALREVAASFRGAMLPPPEVERVCMESIALYEGLVRGAARYLLPRLLEEYDVEAIEYEATAEVASDVVLAAKPDLLLRRKRDRTLWYYEYKTTSSLRDSWFASWDYAVQLHAGATVVARQIGEPLEGCVIQALSKGYEQKGRISSPFCYGYTQPSAIPGEPLIGYEWRPGARKAASWEQPGGLAHWVQQMPMELLSIQYPSTKPIAIRAREVDAWVRQRIIREREIRAARTAVLAGTNIDEVMDAHFPQHFGMCAPAYGSPCSYQRLCYNPQAAEDPLRFGFVLREPHHPTEQGLLTEPEHPGVSL